MATIRTLGAAAAMAIGLLSCSRRSTVSRSDAEGDAPADVPGVETAQGPPPSAATTSPADSTRDLVPPAPLGEAHRSTMTRLEADTRLRAQLGVLRDHFGADSKGPFDEQRVELPGGRSAFLVSRTDEREPIVLVVSRDDLVWSKLRPTAGILPPVRHLALSPRPDGGVAVFGWVEGLHTVAARMWADDGNPFGDFELFAPDGCDALSAGYAPGDGWVVACASRTGTRVQRMRDDCTLAWGRQVTIVFDTSSTLMLVQREPAIGGDRLLAFRYDLRAHDLWEAPVDLGISAGTTASDRVEATGVRDGVVRVAAQRHAQGKAPLAVEVDSSGRVRPASP
jgi:hypothetical protein